VSEVAESVSSNCSLGAMDWSGCSKGVSSEEHPSATRIKTIEIRGFFMVIGFLTKVAEPFPIKNKSQRFSIKMNLFL
jgi:hypothetical protein